MNNFNLTELDGTNVPSLFITLKQNFLGQAKNFSRKSKHQGLFIVFKHAKLLAPGNGAVIRDLPLRATSSLLCNHCS
jgi:hypothetical protein